MKVQTAPGVFLDLDTVPNPAEFMAELNESWKANPLLRYFPHVKQEPFHKAQTRIKVFLGGTRTGKTTAGTVDDLIQALDEEWVPEHLKRFKQWQPPFKCRIITPDLGHTMQVVLDSLREWCPPSQLSGGSWKEAFRRQERILHLGNGSRFDFMSYETDLDKFGGVSLHRIHYDEEPDGEKGEAIRKQGLRRLVDYRGQEVWTFTPEFGLSWTYDALWDKRGPEVEDRVWANDKLTVVRSASFDNPHIPETDELSEGELTEEEYKVKVLGEFFHIKGLVYDEFTPEKHVVKPPEKKHVQGLQTIVGIDPGYRTTAVVFIGFDKDNSALVYDELYLHKEDALPTPVCEQIKAVLGKWGTKTSHYVIDPVARNASLQSGTENIESAYHREGIHVIPGNNKVEAGILEIKRRLQADHPALLVSSHCQNFLKERERYRIDDKEDGKFAVVKTNDHLLDAARYVCQERTWYQAPPPKHPKHPSFGEDPTFEPPYRPSPPPESSPLGSYT